MLFTQRGGLDHNAVKVNQPQDIQLYNRYINGLDHHDKLCMKHAVVHFSFKAWKYILWYFVNTTIVNAYILYCKTSTRQSKNKYAHFDIKFDIVWDWLQDIYQ